MALVKTMTNVDGQKAATVFSLFVLFRTAIHRFVFRDTRYEMNIVRGIKLRTGT